MTINVNVDRLVSNPDATISRVLVNNKFVCFGLEDEFREEKVVGETRVPAGNYRITLRTDDKFHERYSTRFRDFNRG